MEREICKRKVDELGRIVIPQELRSENEIETGDVLNFIASENGDIILRRLQNFCVFCKSTENLTPVFGKSICKSCKDIICSD